jgi:hypothetical protein
MADLVSTPVPAAAPNAGLFTRLVGVVFAPRDAYTAVAARPKWLGAMAVAIVLMAAIQGGFFSTAVGKEAYVDQALSTLRTFGLAVNDQMVQNIEAQANVAGIRQAVSLVVFIPLVCALFAGLLLAVFTAILGGGATFRQVYAMMAHSMIIGAIQQAFSFPIMYARAEMTSPTKLAVFFPMLDEMGFANYLLSAIDLFYIWSLINVSIGVAVLYKRRTGPVAAVLLGIYAVIAVIIAAVRAF